MVPHAFNPRIREIEAVESEFEASLVYRASSRTTSATQSVKKTEEKQEQEEENSSSLLPNP
jgi:hypothetical protein